MIKSFIPIAESYTSSMNRSASQPKAYQQQGIGRLKSGVVVPLSYIRETLFTNNYEMHYINSLLVLVEESLEARSTIGRKLILRSIIESIYHYGEASLLPAASDDSQRITRFRYLQVLYYQFYMARNVGNSWVNEYLKYRKKAAVFLPNAKLRLFPGDVSGIADKERFKDKDILRCIELVAKKIGFSLHEPQWFQIVYSDMSLLAHGNPFGVSGSKIRKKQKREDCLLYSILLVSLSETTKLMAKSEEIDKKLKKELIEFSNKTLRYHTKEMGPIWQKLSDKQL